MAGRAPRRTPVTTGPHRRLFEPASSPRHRTHHRERCGLEPITRDGLREIGHGHWEGLKRKDVEEHFAAEHAAWEADPFSFAPDGGESGVGVLREPCR